MDQIKITDETWREVWDEIEIRIKKATHPPSQKAINNWTMEIVNRKLKEMRFLIKEKYVPKAKRLTLQN